MTYPWLLVCLAVLMIGITKSGFGSGLGLIVVPIMAIATERTSLGAQAALGLMLPLLICGDIVALYQQRKHASLALVKKLLPATALGVAIGGVFLYLAHHQSKEFAAALINLDIGFESVLLVGLHWYRQFKQPREGVYVPKPWQNHATGAAAGISSTLAHGAGPIIALHLLPQKPSRQTFVGTCAIYFFLLNTTKLLAYAWAGQFTAAPLAFTVRFIPLVLAGSLIGFFLNKRVSDRVFSNIVYAGTFVLGWYLLAIGVIGVWRMI